MQLIDHVEAACMERGLPINLADRKTVKIGNCVNQFHVTESRAGRLVRQLEAYHNIKDRSGALGERFRRIVA